MRLAHATLETGGEGEEQVCVHVYMVESHGQSSIRIYIIIIILLRNQF